MTDLAQRFDSRVLQYLGRDQLTPWGVTLAAKGAAVDRPDVQIALLTAAALFARMTAHVRFDVDDAALTASLQPMGERLLATLYAERARARPHAMQLPVDEALIAAGQVIAFDGASAATIYASGTGWVGEIAAEPLALPSAASSNPFGPSIAAILAASEAFQQAVCPGHRFRPARINTWDWTTTGASPEGVPETDRAQLGSVWTVGVGSVGSAALHFLALATRDWSSRMTDHDVVKVENYSRSPVFGAQDGHGITSKVTSCERHLRAFGIPIDGVFEGSLDEDAAWTQRSPGYPDVLIPTANERNIHALVEMTAPPLQIHATTGGNWQVVLFRHVPGKDACSLCALPDTPRVATTMCSTVTVPTPTGPADAALPFLSFTAGLAIAAELVKIALAGSPNAANRVFIQMQGAPLFQGALTKVAGCICDGRSVALLRRVAGRFGPLTE